jgi:hypothetical protein
MLVIIDKDWAAVKSDWRMPVGLTTPAPERTMASAATVVE